MFVSYIVFAILSVYLFPISSDCLHLYVYSYGHYHKISVRKHTFCHVLPLKTQISLCICTISSFFVISMKKLCILCYPEYVHEGSDKTSKVFWTEGFCIYFQILLLFSCNVNLRLFEINPCPTEPGLVLPLQTVEIQISWLLKKPTDLDLHCLSLRM